jgi:flavin-dependent dehydrogenase
VDAEVIVVGGGISGAATAIGLARRGHQVLVVDRAQFPRDKVCGEGLMPHGVAALRAIGVDPMPLGMPFIGIAYHAGGATALGAFPSGPGVGVRRVALDAAVREAARDAHVELRSGVTVTGLGGVPGAMLVHTRDGTLRCRAVVGADGLHSRIRRLAGLHVEPTGRKRYGLRAHLPAHPGVADRDRVEVFVGRGHELYLTPTAPSESNIAFLLEEDRATALRGDPEGGLRRLLAEHPEVDARFDSDHPISAAAVCGPLAQRPRDVVADGVLLVGDAAGFVDAITGEGMSLGVAAAALAAEVLSDGLRTGRLRADHLQAYRRRRRSELGHMLWLTEIVLWGIRQRPLARRVVGNLARHPDLFGRVLAIQTGELGLAGLGVGGLARLVA